MIANLVNCDDRDSTPDESVCDVADASSALFEWSIYLDPTVCVTLVSCSSGSSATDEVYRTLDRGPDPCFDH